MLTEQQYTELRARYDAYEAERARICAHPGVVEVAEQAQLAPLHVSNEERSAIEVYEFCHDIPERYFLYVSEERREVTTWMGDTLGRITYLGAPYRSNMRDTRRSIDILAINGQRYSGVYFASAGDYARVKRCKAQ